MKSRADRRYVETAIADFVFAEERFLLGDRLLLAVPKFLPAPGGQRRGRKSKRRCAKKLLLGVAFLRPKNLNAGATVRRDYSKIDPDRCQVLLREPLALHAQDVRSLGLLVRATPNRIE